MTKNKRSQFLTLNVVCGFCDEALRNKGVSPRTWAQAARLKVEAERMKEALGSPTLAAKDIMRRHRRMVKVLKEAALKEIVVLEYANAMLLLISQQFYHCPSEAVKAEWDHLWDLAQALYETMDEDLEETASMTAGKNLGLKLWEAAAG